MAMEEKLRMMLQ